ncbi:hypothetical protein [Haladaptatus caseinilyticus]|uniref:hypothetical protein n=1 Tax=Haladaptatus caseinilyticus TaxID=2993314 RepID=UPI00224B2B0E|nr:hypothetical protein [Haladaptatus caseinilyticus]
MAGGTTDWPMYGHDNANTGYDPNGTAPRTGVKERWRASVGTATAQPVIAGE